MTLVPRLPLVVMYHYVCPDDAPVPAGIRPLMTGDFERQLDWLERHFRILPAYEFLDAIRDEPHDGKPPPCLLTFDDGTRDHAEAATPILARRGLSGVFFVLTWPPELKRMPLTHAVHWLLSQGEESVWQAFERAASRELGSADALGDPSEAARIYHYETPLRARIKYAANMALPPDVAERVVEQSIRASGQSPQRLAEEWFVSAEQIVAMRDAGMTIGLHGCSHRSLQVLGPEGIRTEIAHASAYMASLLGERPTWFACPFGGSGASHEAVDAMHAAMRDFGIRGSVTTQKSLVPRDCDPWRLPRFDTIDLPPRKHFVPADVARAAHAGSPA